MQDVIGERGLRVHRIFVLFFKTSNESTVISKRKCLTKLFIIKIMFHYHFIFISINYLEKIHWTQRLNDNDHISWYTVWYKMKLNISNVKQADGNFIPQPVSLKSIVKQITSPGGMHETSARAWCTGKTQRDRVEREVGGGIRMRNTCKSMADSCQCMTKPTAML